MAAYNDPVIARYLPPPENPSAQRRHNAEQQARGSSVDNVITHMTKAPRMVYNDMTVSRQDEAITPRLAGTQHRASPDLARRNRTRFNPLTGSFAETDVDREMRALESTRLSRRQEVQACVPCGPAVVGFIAVLILSGYSHHAWSHPPPAW